MTTRYLLDTNIVSDLVRIPQGRVAARIVAVGEARVCTSIIVAAELRYGAAKKGSPRLTTRGPFCVPAMFPSRRGGRRAAPLRGAAFRLQNEHYMVHEHYMRQYGG